MGEAIAQIREKVEQIFTRAWSEAWRENDRANGSQSLHSLAELGAADGPMMRTPIP